MGLVWAIGNPLMAAPDEPAHAIKAAAIAHGDLTTGSVEIKSRFRSLPDTEVEVPAAYRSLNRRFLCFGRADPPILCLSDSPIGSNRSPSQASTYVGAYPPTYYAIVGWPSRVLPPSAALRMMRILTVMVCAALLASGFASARTQTGHRVLVLLAATALTPMTIFLSASINPNGVEIAAAFCTWLTLLALMDVDGRTPTRLLVRLGVAGALLATARPISPYILVGIVVAVLLIAADRPRLVALVHDPRVRLTAVLLALVGAASAVFAVVNRSSTALIRSPPSTDSRIAQFWDGLSDTGKWLEQLTGVLGWIGLRSPELPKAVVVGWLGIILLATVTALWAGNWRQRSVLGGLVLAVLLLPPLAQAATNSQYSWQGRYILPIAVGIPISAGWILGRNAAGNRLDQRWSRVVLGFVAVGVAVSYSMAFIGTLGFNITGTNRIRPVLDGSSLGPFSPMLLYGAAILTSTAWLARLLFPLFDKRPGRADRSYDIQSLRPTLTMASSQRTATADPDGAM